MGYWVRGRDPAAKSAIPINRVLIRRLRPAPAFDACAGSWPVLVADALLILVATVDSAFRQLGSEFMPPLWEGDLLYMPSTLAGSFDRD